MATFKKFLPWILALVLIGVAIYFFQKMNEEKAKSKVLTTTVPGLQNPPATGGFITEDQLETEVESY